jgi:hypothetical protein
MAASTRTEKLAAIAISFSVFSIFRSNEADQANVLESVLLQAIDGIAGTASGSKHRVATQAILASWFRATSCGLATIQLTKHPMPPSIWPKFHSNYSSGRNKKNTMNLLYFKIND